MRRGDVLHQVLGVTPDRERDLPARVEVRAWTLVTRVREEGATTGAQLWRAECRGERNARGLHPVMTVAVKASGEPYRNGALAMAGGAALYESREAALEAAIEQYDARARRLRQEADAEGALALAARSALLDLYESPRPPAL